jgi:hypothetical protein
LTRKLPLIAQEKVEDYRQKMSNPIEINGKKYKYSPADTISLEEYNPAGTFTDEQLTRIAEYKIFLSERIKNNVLRDLNKKLKMLQNNIDTRKTKFDTLKSIAETQNEVNATRKKIDEDRVEITLYDDGLALHKKIFPIM